MGTFTRRRRRWSASSPEMGLVNPAVRECLYVRGRKRNLDGTHLGWFKALEPSSSSSKKVTTRTQENACENVCERLPGEEEVIVAGAQLTLWFIDRIRRYRDERSNGTRVRKQLSHSRKLSEREFSIKVCLT